MNKGGITLYRGIIPLALGLDIHGGYGETWSRDFEYAKCYARKPESYVLEAVLSSDARRLVLMTVDDEGYSDYVPEGIQRLAEIVQEPWLYDSLMSGRRSLWEVWQPEWTKAFIQAGYDSIFTDGFDGPEKYVLNPDLLEFVHYYRVLPDGQTKAYPIEPGTLERLGYVVGLGTAVMPIGITVIS